MRRSMRSHLLFLIGLSACLGRDLAAATAGDDATALLAQGSNRGGLCLVVGAKDTTLAAALAARSACYVQVLQPDAKLADAWGAAFAASGFQDREKIGVRNAPFDAEQYGANLFNLIVVEDAAALGQAKLVDLCRILVPDGVVACRNAPAGFAAEAKTLSMSNQTVSAYAAAYRKPVTPVNWQPSDSLKWRAGMRAHMAFGICGPTFGAGRFYYREWIEAADGWPTDTSQLVARDAYNGRVLWVKQEDVPWSQWRASQFVQGNWTLGGDEAGRLFAVTKDGKLVCLDGATGEPRFELLAKGAAPGYVRTWQDKYVLYGNTVFSALDGKTLWKWKGADMVLHGDTLVESDGATIRARRLADGTEIFQADLSWRGDRMKKKGMRLLHLGNVIIVTEGGRWERPFVATALSATTGQKLWSYEFGGMFALPPRGEKGKTFEGELGYFGQGNTLVAYCVTPHFRESAEGQKETHFTSLDLATGKVVKEDYGARGTLFGNACGGGPAIIGDYLVYHLNVWLNTLTLERRHPYLVHPACFMQPPTAYGMIYNSPGRKGGSIQGITATGPADIAFDQAPGGKLLQRFAGRPAFQEPVKAGDWPTFRGGNARGNASGATPGVKLVKLWEAKVGLGGRTCGQMNAERTGLTQAVIAYDTAYVADIDAQRIVALDATTGRERWVHHVGSRVDFPPTIYKGLCLVASKDGFVHCLDARTGQLIYKLLVASRERYIGGQEKLESLWPTAADVMVDKDGVGHASAGFAATIHGGNREVSFKVETGEVIDSKVNFEPFSESSYPAPRNHTNIYTEPLPGGFRLTCRAIDDMLGYGNDISRNNEDRAEELFGDQAGGKHGVTGRARGRVVAFDEKLCVAHHMTYGGQSWAVKNPMHLVAVDKDPKQPLWKSEPIELVVDDIVLTPAHAYCVGHYRRVKGEPEIWVVSREDGKVLAKTPVDGFPSFCGMSAAGKRLFVSTREGKLICFGGEI